MPSKGQGVKNVAISRPCSPAFMSNHPGEGDGGNVIVIPELDRK